MTAKATATKARGKASIKGLEALTLEELTYLNQDLMHEREVLLAEANKRQRVVADELEKRFVASQTASLLAGLTDIQKAALVEAIKVGSK